MLKINKNNLFEDQSPYLQQHKNNPVNWQLWSKESLDAAKEKKIPILLSIGYASCHWCHVMAHESFEDKETADLMNKYFLNIKVDREERPDIDYIFQNKLDNTKNNSINKRKFTGSYFTPYPIASYICKKTIKIS